MKTVARVIAIALLVSTAPATWAQSVGDARWESLYDRIIRLEHEMKRMKRDYDARIRRLEKALKAARQGAAGEVGSRKAAEAFKPLPPLRDTDIAPDIGMSATAPDEEVVLGHVGEGAAGNTGRPAPATPRPAPGANAPLSPTPAPPPAAAGPIPLPGAVTGAVGAGAAGATSLAPGQVTSAPLSPPPGAGDTIAPPRPQPQPQPASIPPALAALSADALLNRARQNFLARRHDAAEEAYRAFLARFPNHPKATEARFELGQTLYIKGQFKEAGRLFVDVYRAAPDSRLAPRALLRLGQALKRMGRKKEACAAWDSLLKRYPDSRAATLLAPREMKRLKCRRG